MKVITKSSISEIDITGEAVLVEPSIDYPGQLLLSATSPEVMEGLYPDFVSYFGVLNDISLFGPLSEKLESEGIDLLVFEEAREITDVIESYRKPLDIHGLKLINKQTGEPSSLHGYQNIALSKAVNCRGGNHRKVFFFNLGTGTGKSVLGVSGTLELLNRGEIDLALFFTLKNVKPDIVKLSQSATPLRVKQVEGTREKRKREYAKSDADLYVMNYEKMRWSVDGEFLHELVKGKRVLFVLDEVQKVLNENQARGGLDKLLGATTSAHVWPMSASIINGDPERFWKVFDWCETNPLGTLKDFRKRYVKEKKEVRILIRGRGGKPRSVWKTEYVYDTMKLQEIRHRVADISHVARKTDPGVREHFKGLRFEPIPLDMSKDHQKLHSEIIESLKALSDEEKTQDTLGAFYQAMRYNCLSTEAHKYAANPVSQMLSETLGSKLDKIENVKMERLVEDLQVLLDGGDKVVVFTHWTNMSLNIISNRLTKEKIPHVTHFGGKTEKENQQAQDDFKTSKSPMVFLTSDAGSHGLNLPQARVVINYECPLSYDLLMQRNDRIDRVDSYLNDLEARVYYYSGTLEEKIWYRNNQRRILAANIQGTTEVLGNEENITEKDLQFLLGDY